MVRLFETDTMFRDLLVREPIIGLCDAVLGPQCHLFAQNLVRNGLGQAIDRFHYQMPEHVLEGADERLLRVLGKHPKGPYG